MLPSDHPLIRRDLDILDSLRLPSGLTLAAPGAAYDRIWIRDNCYVGLGYWHAGQRERAVKLFRGLLKIMDRHSWKIDWIIWEGKPAQSYKRIHPRYDANGFEIPEPWGFIQNDAIGLLLWCVGWLEDQGAALLSDANVHLIQKLVWYLAAIQYWDDADNGVWEEIDEVHASSVGCCVAGLKIHRSRVMVPDEIVAEGERVLKALNGRESFERYIDMAQLTLAWPLGFEHEEVILTVERDLLREMGVIRYLGDMYHREAAEAEWTMGLPWLGLCWLTLGQTDKARNYLEWTDRVRLNSLLPEAYLPTSEKEGKRHFEPCDHTPLGWSHALALILRQQLMTLDKGKPTLETAAAHEERDHRPPLADSLSSI